MHCCLSISVPKGARNHLLFTRNIHKSNTLVLQNTEYSVNTHLLGIPRFYDLGVGVPCLTNPSLVFYRTLQRRTSVLVPVPPPPQIPPLSFHDMRQIIAGGWLAYAQAACYQGY